MSDSKRRLWTIPNVLTLIRLILVPVYWVLMLGYHLDYWALGAFLLASATDMLDGFLARRMQCITDFGKLMDPLADKLMVLSVLFTLLIRGIIPWEPVALLGGTTTSRLFVNVREKQSLCYYCAASYTSLTGALCVDSGVEHANAAAARESILKELAALCAGPVEDGELADTKRALKNQLAAVGDTLQGLEGWYFAERMRGADKAPEQVAAEVDAVTADDVLRVLSRFRLSVCYTLTKEAGADA